MTGGLLAVFWGGMALLAFTFAGFPAVVVLRGRWRPRPHLTGDVTPSVTVVVAAHNEAASIAARIENLLSLDYPPDRLEVIVVSDGSADATVAEVAAYAGRGVRLLALPRVGKPVALNHAVAHASGEVVAFSDANSHWRVDALRRLVRPFADPSVGGVAGDQRYLDGAREEASGAGERSYWDFERNLKEAQSRAGSVTSATGAIYAVRRNLTRPLPEGVSDDFVMSARVVEAGQRLVFASDAVAFEPVAATNEAEFGRKLRAIQIGLSGVAAVPSLLNPFRHGFYALQLLIQKVVRRLAVFPLMAVLVAGALLWSDGLPYRATALGGLAFVGAALVGRALQAVPVARVKLLTLPWYFCLVYAAAAIATVRLVRGRRLTTWETARGTLDAEAAS